MATNSSKRVFISNDGNRDVPDGPENQQTKKDGSLLQLGVRLVPLPLPLGPRPLPAQLPFHLTGGLPLGRQGWGWLVGGAGVAAGHQFQTHQLTVMKYV